MTYLSRVAGHILGFALLPLILAAPPASAGISSCPGDCNGDQIVTVDELVRGVNIALDQQTIDSCPAFDRNSDGQVTIEELLAAVSAAIGTCPAAPTPTATGTTGEATSTPEATVTGTVVATSTATRTATSTGSAVATPTSTATVEPSETAEPTQTPEATDTEPPTPTPTTTPSGTTSDLIAVIDGGEVRLAWTNPDPSGGYTQALVLRRLNAPVDGPEDPQATLVFLGSSAMTVHTLTDLLPSVPEQTRVYHYAVFPCTSSGECGSTPATEPATPTLPEVLRGGGYVLHWRHAAADVCTDHLEFGTAANPLEPNWWKSCESDCDAARAQQLNDKGRADAVAIGKAFDILRIPVGRVVSSEFCRDVTTAELMEFGPPIEQSPALTYFVYDEANRCADSYALIDQAPAQGTNTALIGHAGFEPPCPVLSELAAGEAAVFKSDGMGGVSSSPVSPRTSGTRCCRRGRVRCRPTSTRRMSASPG